MDEILNNTSRVLNALLPPCALVAVADVVAAPRRLSVSQYGRGDTTYVPAESLNPPTPLAALRAAPALPPAPAPRGSLTLSAERLGAEPQEREDRDVEAPEAEREGAAAEALEPPQWREEGSVAQGETTVTTDLQPIREAQKFQSADDLNPPSPSRGLDRLHVSAPDLSSLRGRAAAPPPPRLVAPPPPPQPPPPEAGDAVYDKPRRRPVTVPVDRLVEEVTALRRDNYQLRHMVHRSQTAATGGESAERERGRREDQLRSARRHTDRLAREADQLAEANRRLAAENSRLRAQPDRQDSAALRQLVVRLSEQLSRQLGQPPAEADLLSRLNDPRRLPPLLEAYDQVKAELTEQTERLRSELSELRQQLQQLTEENEKLHADAAEAQTKPGVTHHEWRQLSENARLVIEENQLLTDQVQILKEKQAELTAEHHRREAELSSRLTDLQQTVTEQRARLEAEQAGRQQLADERDRLLQQLERSIPREQHEQAVAECRRLFEELRSRYGSERLSLLSDVEAQQSERRRLVVQLTEAATQRAAADTKLRAANKTIARLERRISSLQGELDSAQKVNSEASEHLAEVLSATDQLMAERSQLARLNSSQLSDGDKLMERFGDERAHNLRLRDKIKSVRRECQQQLERADAELAELSRAHELRSAEYERQLAFLRARLADEQRQLETARTDNRRVTEELNVLSRAATAENQKLKEQLQLVPERDSGASDGK
ncbi:Centrosomal protein [Amphibalanus amphitrite]|uniref:Centrosomal protein n=1 Tax=Amphibalanus amphitrite TaxID=1232801 RepID=A0A6A4W4C9_AMPAM|nr:Centrosomal protein [Amphibalanus amphitrite]